jgi:hypothetical protein
MQSVMELSVFTVTPELSKQVGHAPRYITRFPDMGQVRNAGAFTLLVWYRNLPCAETREEHEILGVIMYRLSLPGGRS